MNESISRRPLKSRQRGWAQRMAGFLAGRGISPNAISVMSVLFAAFAAASLLATLLKPTFLLFIAAAVFVQLRLICNLMDGMVAVEFNRKSKTGLLFNDFPDRIADPLILVSAGYAITCSCGITLGWAAGSLAILSAYTRYLGTAAGASEYFSGPMAKPQRMALMTLAFLLSAAMMPHRNIILASALGLVVVGCLITIARRLALIAKELNAQ